MGKILIVDDEEILLMLAQNLLDKQYEVVTAGSGESAIEIYDREKPDLILSDLIMPNMTGYEMMEQIRQRHPGETIPVMFMTGAPGSDSETRSFETGAVDYIRKPFKPYVLLRRVSNIMEQIQQVKSLKKVNEIDPMTGLLNKASATEAARTACLTETGSLFMIDLDNFKLVNDLFGHEAGDKILIEFAGILQSVLRVGDIIGRIGGDEFLAFCYNLQTEQVITEKAGSINEMLQEAATLIMGDGHGIPIGVSIGVVCVPEHGTDYADLFQLADKALYHVKHNGKHGCMLHQGKAPETESTEIEISKVHTILKERNDKKGALDVSFDVFQGIYRFLMRSIENHHRETMAFILLTVHGSDNAAPGEEILTRFNEILTGTLRRSDIVTRHGKDQFMVMLPETEFESSRVAAERVLFSWKTKARTFAEQCSVSYEIEDIAP